MKHHDSAPQIRHLKGELAAVEDGAVVVDVNGVGYEVLVSEPLAERLRDHGLGSHVELATYYCERGGPGGATPMLVGFESEAGREFFERLLSVPQLGPVGAIKALVLPVSTIARALELGDTKTLETLPGVGKQRARDMVSKLQGKVGRFVGEELEAAGEAVGDEVAMQAVEVLAQLGVTRDQAIKRIREVREAEPEIESVDDIVRAAFRRK